jgi:uncharacterized protein (DUF2336 family)
VQNADSSSLFDDLDAALRSGASEKRVALLRQVTDLFLSEADRLNGKQIGVFDGVLVQLIERIETRTLVEISECLASVANAPIDLTLNLARHSARNLPRRRDTRGLRLNSQNYRNRTPGDCFDFGRSAK